MVAIGVSGHSIQDDDPDTGHCKDSISDDRYLQISLLGTPVVLRKQADHDPDNGRYPNDSFNAYRGGKFREGKYPDVH